MRSSFFQSSAHCGMSECHFASQDSHTYFCEKTSAVVAATCQLSLNRHASSSNVREVLLRY